MTVWGNRKPLEREMRENTQDGTPGSWFRVTVSILKNVWNVQERKVRESCVGLMLRCWFISLGTACKLSFL